MDELFYCINGNTDSIVKTAEKTIQLSKVRLSHLKSKHKSMTSNSCPNSEELEKVQESIRQTEAFIKSQMELKDQVVDMCVFTSQGAGRVDEWFKKHGW